MNRFTEAEHPAYRGTMVSADITSILWVMLKPELGGIRSMPRRGGASGFAWTRPVGGPLFDFYVEPSMLDSYICIL